MMADKELIDELELLKEKYERHEKILIQAYFTLKKRESDLNTANKKLHESEEQLKSAIEELRAVNEELSEKNGIIRTRNTELQDALNDLKNAQTNLIQSEKLATIGILTAGVAHEINNPLNFIKGASIALESKLKNICGELDQETLLLLESISTGVRRVSRIVQSLNQFNRKSASFDERCNLAEIIENCLIIMNSSLKDRISISKNYSTADLIISGNQDKLHQVFLNILLNAEQSITHEGNITVTTSRSMNFCTVEIADTGTGIRGDLIDKITEPFFTTKDPGKGAGLGLSIAHSNIKEHGGELRFRSVLGKGTTVTVILPIIS
jgi:signal transduction histidine kinase